MSWLRSVWRELLDLRDVVRGARRDLEREKQRRRERGLR